jgi:2-octaprenyl-6-methoxyphenol hydroxylase
LFILQIETPNEYLYMDTTRLNNVNNDSNEDPFVKKSLTLIKAPLLIVGGGMVGLTLALMLAQKGLPVTVLEAIRYPENTSETPYYSSFDARNTALSRRTVQIFTDLGLWSVLQEFATPILQIHISEQGSFGKARLDAVQEGLESFGQVIENAWLGRVLLSKVRTNELITLIDGVSVTELTQDGEYVTITAMKQTASGENQVFNMKSPILIAADGRDSFCRRAVGVDVSEHDYGQVALVTTVQTSKPHGQQAFERFSPQGPLALLPLCGDHRRSVVWTVPTGTEQDWLGAENDSRFLDALQETFGNRAGRFEKTGNRFAYPLAQVLAQRQAIGRVVLMGNAAHTLHPVAGQGFNLCIRDAQVLTQTLAAQANQERDLGEHEVLADYEKSRLTDQKRVIRFCDSIVRGFTHSNPLLKLARNTGLLAFDAIPGAKQLVANYAMGLKV